MRALAPAFPTILAANQNVGDALMQMLGDTTSDALQIGVGFVQRVVLPIILLGLFVYLIYACISYINAKRSHDEDLGQKTTQIIVVVLVMIAVGALTAALPSFLESSTGIGLDGTSTGVSSR